MYGKLHSLDNALWQGFLARPLNLAAMSDLRTTLRDSALSGVFEIVFFMKPHKLIEEQRIG